MALKLVKEFSRDIKAGIAATLGVINALKLATAQGVQDGVEASGKAVLNRSNFYVPVSEDGSVVNGVLQEPGLLKRSGRVESQEIVGGVFQAYVMYGPGPGGNDAFYAVYVHERQARHKSPTQWKYLEKAVQETTSRCEQLMRKYTGEAIQSAVAYSERHKGQAHYTRVYGQKLEGDE